MVSPLLYLVPVIELRQPTVKLVPQVAKPLPPARSGKSLYMLIREHYNMEYVNTS